MADVLVTGAAGLVGSRLVQALAEGHEVTALVRRPPPASRPGSIRWLVHDLEDPALEGALPTRIDVVVHLAQGMTFRQFPEGAAGTFGVNVASTVRLLDWARRAGARQFILASTGSVYTRSTQGAHTEDEDITLSSLSFYAASKLAGEVLAMAYRPYFHVMALRPFTIYGPGQNATMLVPRLVSSVRRRQPVRLAGAHGLTVNPVYVDDAASAIVKALSVARTTVVNLAGPDVVSLREMSECIARHLGVTPRFETVDEEAPAVVGDIARMTDLLGPPRTRFADAVPRLCEPAQGG